jgi:hypothetical protein
MLCDVGALYFDLLFIYLFLKTINIMREKEKKFNGLSK